MRTASQINVITSGPLNFLDAFGLADSSSSANGGSFSLGTSPVTQGISALGHGAELAGNGKWEGGNFELQIS